jgi:multiple sugar transport system substrate-binding protein
MDFLKLLASFALITLVGVLSCSKGAEDGRKVITFWQFWTDPIVKPTVLELIEEFERENPEIEVKITDLTWSEGHQKIVVAFASGDPPDVLELGSDWVPEFSHRGVLMDVTGEASQILEHFMMWEPVRWEQGYFGFPWFLDTRVIFFNKDLMRRAGLGPEHPPGSWSGLLDACRRIDGLSEDIHGFGANSAERHRLYKKFLPFLWSNGGRVLSDDGNTTLMDTPEALEALRYYLDLVRVGKLDTQRNLDEAFMRGEIGFILSGGWLLREIPRVAPALDYGVTFIPSPDGARPGVSFAGGEYLVISEKSKHGAEALKLIRFLIASENALSLCRSIGSGFPAAKIDDEELYHGNDPNLKIFYEQLQNSNPSPVHPKWVYIEEITERGLERAMYGRVTPSECLLEMTSQIKEALD